MIGLFCKRALQKRLYSAKETYDFKESTNRSHPIPCTGTMTLELALKNVISWKCVSYPSDNLKRDLEQ